MKHSPAEPRLPHDVLLPQDQATVERNAVFNSTIEQMRTIGRKLAALEDSDLSIQALAGRNAVVDIQNTFGKQFRALQENDIESVSVDNEAQLDQLLQGIHDILELVAGQLPDQPILTPTKVVTKDPESLSYLFISLAQDLQHLVVQHTRFGASKIDVMMMMLRKLYVYWDDTHNLV